MASATPSTPIRFGIVFNCTNQQPWSQPWEQIYEEVLAQAAAAEEMGYAHVWLTEHHFLENGYCPSLLTVASAIAARTSRIRIGTWVLLLPLHNALRVAEDAAAVDVISKGRLILGVGLGYRIEEFEALGVPREQRAARMEESVELLRLAWSQERFSFHGERYNVDDLTVTPRPVQAGGPRIWMAARGERPARRAARLGCPLALAAGGGRHELDLWRDGLRTQGKDPDDLEVLVSRNVYVTDDVEATKREILPFLTWDQEGATDLIRYYREAGDLKRDAAFFQNPQTKDTPRAWPIMGDADACTEQMEAMQADVPATDVHLTFANGMSHERKLHYMERFAREVLPRFAGRGLGAPR